MKKLLLKTKLVISAFVLTVVPAFAQLYQGVDENGNVIFTDKPDKYADKSLQVVNPIERSRVAIPNQPSSESNLRELTEGKAEKKFSSTDNNKVSNKTRNKTNYKQIEYQLKISSPESGTTIYKAHPVPVSVDVTPAIQNGDAIVIFLDGKKVAEGKTSTSLSTVEMNRGMHTIKVVIMNKAGKQIAQVETSFLLYQHSRLFKKNFKKKKEEKKRPGLTIKI